MIMHESQTVTTATIMTGSDKLGTFALVNKVQEPVSSALEHLEAMGKGKPEPVYDVRSGGWRWTWEYVNDQGIRCTDTVRIYRRSRHGRLPSAG